MIDRDNDNVDDVQELKLDATKDGWKNRRAIAWVSFLTAVLFYPVLVIICWTIDSTLVDKVLVLSTPIYTLCGVNLTAYYTFTTWQSISGKEL